MKAIVYRNYGSPDVLRYEEIEKPTPGANEVLVKIRAASVNPYDWHFMRGTPYLVRIVAGVRRPKVIRLGADVAGEVESAGKNVTQFRSGDAVFGTSRGAFAEYVCTDETALAAKPANVTFEQSASVPIAAFTALQGLRKGNVQPACKVLINGAAGGVGTFAVQIAKSFGADVTGVCSTRNVNMIRSIGADRAIDYTQEDFTRGAARYDLVLDAIGNHPFAEVKRALNPHGVCVVAGSPDTPWMIGPLARMGKEILASSFTSQKRLGVLAKANEPDLITLRDLLETKKVVPVIDRCYDLSQVPEAIRYVEQRHARGKVVITMSS